jgi:hypothetical protein
MSSFPSSPKDLLDNVIGAFFIGGTIIFSPILRQRYNHWGATPAEVARSLPGDHQVPQPRQSYTRAITIHTPAAAIWPWIVQMGQGRGGLYSYDLLENLIGCDIHSANSIDVSLQNLQVDDEVRLGPKGYPLFKVFAVIPGRALVLVGADPKTGKIFQPSDPPAAHFANAVWTFYLDPITHDTTRLIVRSRLDYSPTLADTLLWRITEALNFIMERKMLFGIKQRAEVWNQKMRRKFAA